MSSRMLRILSLLLVLVFLLPCAVSAAEENVPAFTNIVLQLGADESKLNFTWYSLDDGEGTITYAKATDLVDGAFPSDASVATAARTASVKKGYYANKATIEGLLPETEYVYQLANGADKSDMIPFTTGKSGDFSFAVVGDMQIGAGELGVEQNELDWSRTLNQLVTANEFESADFLLSVGDQINQLIYNYDEHEAQFDAYSNHEELLSIPTVVTLGNHDNYDDSVYPYHFNEPNLDLSAGVTKDSKTGVVNSADYWFTYNSVLFLVLNNNDFLDYSGSDSARAADKAAAERHAAFIERVMEETKDMDIDWKIVVWHRSPYGSSYHNNYTVNEGGVYNRLEQYNYVNMREYLVPVLYENGIDLVLSGHDHCYTRSHIIKPAQDENGNYIDASVITPFTDGSYTFGNGTNVPKFRVWQDASGVYHTNLKTVVKPVSVTNPDGILHVTAATASGSQVNETQFQDKYAAVTGTADTRQMIRIDITENSLTLVNYNLGTSDTDEITEYDRFTIYHEAPAAEVEPEETDTAASVDTAQTEPPADIEPTSGDTPQDALPADTEDKSGWVQIVSVILSTLGLVAMILASVLKGRTMKLILPLVFLANFLVALSYLVLENGAGAVTCFIGAVQAVICAVYDTKEKKVPVWLLAVFAASFIAANLIVSREILVILPILGALTFIAAIIQKNGKMYRVWFASNALIWGVYAVLTAAWGPLFTNIIAFAFTALGMILHDRKKG